MSSAPLGVLVAEDHALVADGIVAVVHRMPGLAVAGQVSSLPEIPPALARLTPAILLLDLHLRREPSWSHCAGFRRQSPLLRIIGISALPPDPAALRAVDDFVPKGDLGRVLAPLLRSPQFRASAASAPHSPFTNRFVQHAWQEARDYLAALRAALEHRDQRRAVPLAHALKNVADMVGPAALCDACQRLHNRIHEADWSAAALEQEEIGRRLEFPPATAT